MQVLCTVLFSTLAALPALAFTLTPNPASCTLSGTVLSCGSVSGSGTYTEGYWIINASNLYETGYVAGATGASSMDFSTFVSPIDYSAAPTGTRGQNGGAGFHVACGSVTSIGYIVGTGNTVPPNFTGWSFSTPATFSVSGVCGAPVISSPSATPDYRSATLTWNTDLASSSTVCYGASSHSTCLDYDAVVGQASESVTSHAVALSSLLPGTTYHYMLCSTGTVSHRAGCTSDSTFATLGATTAASPAAFVTAPASDFTAPQQTLTSNMFFVFGSTVPVTDYPTSTVTFEYVIAKDGSDDYTHDLPVTASTMFCSSPPTLDVNGSLQQVGCPYYFAAAPTDYQFQNGHDYTVRVKAEVDSGGFGSFSAAVPFHAAAGSGFASSTPGATPACTVFSTGGPPDGATCLWTWTVWWIEVPGGMAVNDAWNGLTLRIVTRWPLAYVFDILGSVRNGLNGSVPVCPLPTVPDTNDNGYIIKGYDTCSVITETTTALNGDSDLQGDGVTLVYLGAALTLLALASRFMNV